MIESEFIVTSETPRGELQKFPHDKLSYVSFTEEEAPGLVLTAHQVHAQSYVGENFVVEAAIQEDGTLPPDLDKSRGKNIEYYIGYQQKDNELVPVSTLRKVSVQEKDVRTLPGIRMSQEAIDPEIFDALLHLPDTSVVKEISSFGHVPDMTSLDGLEMLRRTLQDTLGSGEIWFFSMVEKKYKTLVSLFGPKAVRKIGEPIALEDPRVNNISLVPALVYTDSFFEDILEGINSETNKRLVQRYGKMLEEFTKGLSEDQLPDEVAAFLSVQKSKETTFNFDALIKKANIPEQLEEWNEPTVFDFTSKNDQKRMKTMVENGDIRRVIDPPTLAEELVELYKSQGKTDISQKDIEARGVEFGKWVHYPWSGELVHFPDQDDYQMLRTQRNRNLISEKEQRILLAARPLVAGLSVGSNVVSQLVRSGIGNVYTLADPDTLSVTNLNRLDAGMRNVGESKVDIAAKNISELDPYIDQHHLRSGVTADNLLRLDSRQASIVIEETDDFAAKVLLREYARDHQLPLVMVSDVGRRTLIDVERHDLGPTPLFNDRLSRGLIDAMRAGELSEKDRMKVLVKLIGLSNASFRLLSSIGDPNVAGMPQLNTAAKRGGVEAADYISAITLGAKIESGRYIAKPSQATRSLSSVPPKDALAITRSFITKR